jgi:hypothetical protein
VLKVPETKHTPSLRLPVHVEQNISNARQYAKNGEILSASAQFEMAISYLSRIPLQQRNTATRLHLIECLSELADIRMQLQEWRMAQLNCRFALQVLQNIGGGQCGHEDRCKALEKVLLEKYQEAKQQVKRPSIRLSVFPEHSAATTKPQTLPPVRQPVPLENKSESKQEEEKSFIVEKIYSLFGLFSLSNIAIPELIEHLHDGRNEFTPIM